MDFYITDRRYNLLAIASTDGTGDFYISDDTDTELVPQAVGRSYAGAINFAPAQIDTAKKLAETGNYMLYQDERGRYVFATMMETELNVLNGTIDFTAENGGVDLINETVGAYKAAKAMTIAEYLAIFAWDSGFDIGINEISTLTRTLEWTSEETALARVEAVAANFDAELDFRFDIDGTQVVKRYIDIYKKIGADKDQRLEVNTHINSIVTTSNIYDLYTSVIASGDTAEGSDTPITLKGYKWTDPDGRYTLDDAGTLRDTVAVQLWSRALSNANPNPLGNHIQRVKTYTAKSQAELLQSALADLKKYNHASVNYTVDLAYLPDNIAVGDTVHLVDEEQDLNLSTRLLELKTSYSADTRQATFGDYLIETSQIDPQYRVLAETLAKQNKGKDGADAVVLSVSSVNGNMFKNTGISTILTVSISVGGSILDTAEKMHAVFGADAYLQWQVKNAGELEFKDVSLTDTRLSDGGFLFAVSAEDVNNKSTFKCELYY
ncbi:phage tail spike protein [Lacticaseibacillus suibinensis]|uniref:phage tail spike protein n=1 Tax=Lacticaseibacillus suibinensis TaxID=2486011 RepID=UPI00194468DD|nr:phage tail spike protein [Lacticaseibacillus suibinensis]